ncbi:tRNA:m4X modification enzyme [Mortierella polycephala]|uniref:tRNA:m(4)X modification enzyme TRM13 n=1 Tax=Mortierella polycephala TaxID=41804 RepID=A0A9P6QJ86_9FUNG|nr:tRNA:m4X modification enzyme [Mortierella polycephala]
MQHHPVICQHAIWGSKQQRYRHCKLPAKLSPALLDQIKQVDQQCFSAETAATEQERNEQLNRFLKLRKDLLQLEYDAHRVLCGHHQKEAQATQAKQDQIEKEKAAGTYQDLDELERLSKVQPVDPNDIPKDFLAAVERVFSIEPSIWVKEVLDQYDGPEEWKMGRRSRGRGIGGDEDDLALDGDSGHEREYPCHESYENLFAEAGVKKKRHLAQESQLIRSMSTLGLLDSLFDNRKHEIDSQETEGIPKQQQPTIGQSKRTVFVEFGAGTGGLSRHLQLVLETMTLRRATGADYMQATPTTIPEGTVDPLDPFNFILLDRQKFRSRNQVDYMIRTQARPIKPRLLRITKDVRELELKNLQLIHETEPGVARPEWTEGGGDADPQESSTKIPTHYICISKHFCGPATDLALAWLQDQHRNQQKQSEDQQDMYSLCFATCCHGICEPSLVVAKPYLRELLSVSSVKKRKRAELNNADEVRSPVNDAQTMVPAEQMDEWIPWIIKLTGWATLGKQEESSLVARPGKDVPTAGEMDGKTMTRDQRRVLGKRCKKLLDVARCMYLIRECGFRDAKAIEYTTESVESGAIVGTM